MKLMLAPLEGVSDCAFRTLCYQHGADLTFTEMIRVDSLVRKNKATLAMLDLLNNTPTGIQLLAVKRDILQQFAASFSSYNITSACFNLNLGCPSPDVITQGGGVALMKRCQRVNELVGILRKLGLPISIKMRLGLNAYEKKHKVYLNLIKTVDADAFIIHARHARQSSQEPADWSVFEECIATGKHIIPNGDIHKREHVASFKNLGIKEVMIGRAAVVNPSIFNYLKGKDLLSPEQLKEEYACLCKKYPSHPKYRENVLSYLGKELKFVHSKKWLM